MDVRLDDDRRLWIPGAELGRFRIRNRVLPTMGRVSTPFVSLIPSPSPETPNLTILATDRFLLS